MFPFDLCETTQRARQGIERGIYIDIGLVALYEGHALDTEGVFGTLPECYVRPAFRRTVRFYEANGFHITGSRKLKIV